MVKVASFDTRVCPMGSAVPKIRSAFFREIMPRPGSVSARLTLPAKMVGVKTSMNPVETSRTERVNSVAFPVSCPVWNCTPSCAQLSRA